MAKRKLLELTYALDVAPQDPSGCAIAMDYASQLKEMLKGDGVSLTVSEKLTVIKSLTRAKVKALRTGVDDNYRTFRALDLITGDLLQLL